MTINRPINGGNSMKRQERASGTILAVTISSLPFGPEHTPNVCTRR
jgi:hypothetical protein